MMKLGRKIKKLKSKFLYFLRKNIHLEIYEENYYQINKIFNELGFNQIKKFKERSNYLYSNFIN